MKILFITSTRLGDAILSTGLLDHISTQYKEAQVYIASGSLPAPLFKAYPNLWHHHVIERKKYALHWLVLWSKVISTKWDMVIDLRGTAISFFLNARKRYIWRSQETGKHRVEQLSALLDLPMPAAPHLWVEKETLESVTHLLPSSGLRIVLSPCANWSGKEWPLEKYVELIEQHFLPDQQVSQIYLLGASQDHDRIQPLAERFASDQVVNLAGKLSLAEVVALLSKCDLFVGSDSGLMHMAAALDIPTVGLFGPSRDDLYAPWGEKTAVVRTDESYEELFKHAHLQTSLLTSIPVSRVWDAIKKVRLT